MPELAVDTLSFDVFCGLETRWAELVEASDRPSPFLSHPWLRLWWQHFGSDQEFVAVVVRDGERLQAGVPLALRTVRPAGVRLIVGEIVGTGPVPTRGMGLADKADVLATGDAPAAKRLLCSELVRLLDRFDVLDLKGMDATSETAAALTRAASRSLGARILPRSVSPYLELSLPWGEYLRARSANFREHLKKYRRRLGQAGSVTIARLQPRDDCGTWMAEALAVNEASWTAQRGTDLFRHPRLRTFLLELAAEFAQRGWLDLHVLRIDDRPVAYELGFDFGGRVFSYNSSYDGTLARHSPGTLVTAAVIEAACARGRTEYDMLRGDEEYKRRWSETQRAEVEVLVPAPRWRSRCYARLGLQAKARLKRSPWLNELDDRLSGVLSRLRYRTPPT